MNKEEEAIQKMMGKYYKSVSPGRAIGEMKFNLSKHLEKINFGLKYSDSEELLKEKEEIEKKLNLINEAYKERYKEFREKAVERARKYRDIK